MNHLSMQELEAGLAEILKSPRNNGTLKFICRRPDINEREVVESAQLDREEGLIGDNWKTRGSKRTSDGSAHPDMQLNIMNARAIELIAQTKERWPLAGDQLFLDLELSDDNIPPGTQLSLGEAIIEITAIPHNGCKKFTQRFGLDAVKFVNSPTGKEFHLRGVNAKVIKSGSIKIGDKARKLN